MEIIALLSGANEIYAILPNLRPEKVSKFGTLFQIFQFVWANFRARLTFNRSMRELSRLLQKDRIVAHPVKAREILYLKTNLWYGAKAGGSVGHVAGVINGFVKKNWPITFASIEPPIMAEDKVDLFEVPFPTQLAYPPDLNNYVYNREIVDRVKELAKRRNFEMIYQRMSINNYSGVQLSRELGVPLILEYNGSEVWISRNWGRPLVFEKQALLCEDVCLKHAHVVVTVSDVLRDELIERGVEPEKIVTYPNCVDPDVFTPGLLPATEAEELRACLGFTSQDRIATFVGTFGKWHGVELLAKSIRFLVDNHRDWLESTQLKFLLVGDGFLMPEVKKEIGEAPYSEFAKLTGLVPQREAPKYLEISEILLSPHVPNSDGSRFFGSPTKLFEYMAMGKPIIASDLEQIGEVLRQSIQVQSCSKEPGPHEKAMALLVEAGNEKALVDGIRFLVDHPEWMPRLGENARKEALSKYTWADHVSAIIEKVKQIPHAGIESVQRTWTHSFFESQFFWAHRMTKYSFVRKVIDRLSTLFLVSAIGHKELQVQSRRGLRYSLRYPEDIGWESLIVFKDYETGTSDLIETLLTEGDTVYDVGANLGWYTTLAAKHVGAQGQVHAFEPVPKIFDKLKRNCQLNQDLVPQIHFYNEAISDREKDFELFSYEGLPHGLTSAKALYGEKEKVTRTQVHATTLDRVWERAGRPSIKMVKVDVEGLEYNVLLGAKQLIQDEGPLWLIEINYQTSEAFNWSPEQLLSFLTDHNQYEFMRVNEAWGQMSPVKSISSLRNGDVILCYIPGKHSIPRTHTKSPLSHPPQKRAH